MIWLLTLLVLFGIFIFGVAMYNALCVAWEIICEISKLKKRFHENENDS